MRVSRTFASIVAAVTILFCGTALSAGKGADDLAGLVKDLMAHAGDWSSVEGVKGAVWQPLPPKMLNDCLPDGGCFTRSGVAKVGGRRVSLLVTGARTMTFNFYVKNSGPHVGEAALLDALTRAGLSPAIARCPLKPNDLEHNSKWWRVKSGQALGYVSLTYSCGAKRCEGVGYSVGPDLPKLDPGELAMYSEQCAAGSAPVKAVSAELPHQAIAKTIAGAIPAAGEAQPYSWDTMRTRLPGFSWNKALWPHDPALSYDDDPNHFSLSGAGMLSLATREFSVQATGDAKYARLLRLEEGGSHPRGEDVKLLQALRDDGFTIALARCGKIYTEQKLTWYKLTKDSKRPAFLLIDTGNEGKREHARYRLYLDGALPSLRPGEANAGTGRCR
ncbi:MAG: hypothetical protein KBA31_18255 [Alphaproteobacteria bacterium]|nr:hypothetical protein [Alphaproteobacteria bacterium]